MSWISGVSKLFLIVSWVGNALWIGVFSSAVLSSLSGLWLVLILSLRSDFMVHVYVSVKKVVFASHVSKRKTFRSCVDCGVPLPRSGGVVERCRSCSLKYRWRLYRMSHGLDA